MCRASSRTATMRVSPALPKLPTKGSIPAVLAGGQLQEDDDEDEFEERCGSDDENELPPDSENDCDDSSSNDDSDSQVGNDSKSDGSDDDDDDDDEDQEDLQPGDDDDKPKRGQRGSLARSCASSRGSHMLVGKGLPKSKSQRSTGSVASVGCQDARGARVARFQKLSEPLAPRESSLKKTDEVARKKEENAPPPKKSQVGKDALKKLDRLADECKQVLATQAGKHDLAKRLTQALANIRAHGQEAPQTTEEGMQPEDFAHNIRESSKKIEALGARAKCNKVRYEEINAFEEEVDAEFETFEQSLSAATTYLESVEYVFAKCRNEKRSQQAKVRS